MTHKQRGYGARPAFTLIELLVVISIIAILVSLTAAAVMRALVKGPELQTVSEANEFTTKLASEQSDLGAPVLPSHLRLREDSAYSDPINAARNADLLQTKAFLQQAFGRHITDAGVQIDWNGDGTVTTTSGAAGDLVLEGEQCLVFWLGGVPKTVGGSIGMTGFPPQVAGGGTGKRGPFFEFQSARLRMFSAPDPLNSNNPSLPFPVYLDPWNSGSGPWGRGMAYAFFASYRTAGNGLYQADCPSFGVSPYQEPSGKFANASSFQIVSAGRDGKFGAGGANWNPANGTADPNGKDDQSNFSPRLLGAPAN
jgi:prepilin-type N-terminal cleavage/methylation domain-containing protein